MKKTILVVDDSYTFRSLIKKTLHKDSYEVIAEAKNGIEALKFFKEHKPDIIITDIKMPKMDGYKLIKEIIEISPHAKIMAVLTFGSKEDIEYVYEIGASTYINKPFQANFLFKRLKSMFEVSYEKNLKDSKEINQGDSSINVNKQDPSIDLIKAKNNEAEEDSVNVEEDEEPIEIFTDNTHNKDIIEVSNENDIFIFDDEELKRQEDREGTEILESIKSEDSKIEKESKETVVNKKEEEQNTMSKAYNKRYQVIKETEITDDMNINDLFFDNEDDVEENSGIIDKIKGLFK